MTTREEASALVQQMQECFNSRRFDEADGLSTPDCFSHPLGTTGVEAGKQPGAPWGASTGFPASASPKYLLSRINEPGH